MRRAITVIVMDCKCHYDIGFDTFVVSRKKSSGSRPLLRLERMLLLHRNRLICVVMKLAYEEHDCLMLGVIGLS